MEIHQYDGRLLRELTATYNEAIRKIPHCYPVSVRDFAEALAPATGGADHENRHSEAIFVALDPSRPTASGVVGFIHAAIGHPRQHGRFNPADPEQGLICFFCYQPGYRRAGELLLDAAESYCQDHLTQAATEQATEQATERGPIGIFAFSSRHVYPFYHFVSAYMSDRLGHVASVLGLRGYERVAGEVYLNWRDFEIGLPDSNSDPIDFTVEYPSGRGRRPGVVVRAQVDGQEIGICQNYCGAEYTRAHPSQDWIFTKWLGVAEEHQGRGLGRTLLQRALYEAREQGYRHAAISTSWTNHRALAFYSNFGYEIVDWTYCMARDLT